MKSVIEKLFYDEIEKVTLPKENKLNKEESELYEKLRQGLTDEQKQLFLRFDDLKNKIHLEEERELYVLGFQTGARALMEILNLHVGK